ncbi:MAG: DMT family transporter [Clostridia bacterium]
MKAMIWVFCFLAVFLLFRWNIIPDGYKDPLQVGFFVWLLLLLSLNIGYAAANKFKELKKPGKAWPMFLSSVLLYGFVYFFIRISGEMAVENTDLLLLAFPVLMMVLTPLMAGKKKISIPKFLVFTVALAGAVIILFWGRAFHTDWKTLLIVAGCGLCWAAFSILADREKKKMWAYLYYSVLGCALLSLALLLAFSRFVLPPVDEALRILLLALGIIAMALFWLSAIRQSGIPLVSTVAYAGFIPLLAVPFIASGDIPGTTALSGAGMILLATVIMALLKEKRRKPKGKKDPEPGRRKSF